MARHFWLYLKWNLNSIAYKINDPQVDLYLKVPLLPFLYIWNSFINVRIEWQYYKEFINCYNCYHWLCSIASINRMLWNVYSCIFSVLHLKHRYIFFIRKTILILRKYGNGASLMNPTIFLGYCFYFLTNFVWKKN